MVKKATWFNAARNLYPGGAQMRTQLSNKRLPSTHQMKDATYVLPTGSQLNEPTNLGAYHNFVDDYPIFHYSAVNFATSYTIVINDELRGGGASPDELILDYTNDTNPTEAEDNDNPNWE